MNKLLAQIQVPGAGDTTREIRAPSGIPNNIDLSTLLEFFVGLLFVGGVVLSLGALIWGGIQYTKSRGDEEMVQRARMTIIYAIVGLIIIAFAFVVVQFVWGLFF